MLATQIMQCSATQRQHVLSTACSKPSKHLSQLHPLRPAHTVSLRPQKQPPTCWRNMNQSVSTLCSQQASSSRVGLLSTCGGAWLMQQVQMHPVQDRTARTSCL